MNTHVIKQGETASAIAKKEGISLSAMRQLNPGINLDKLSIGQQLVLHASNAQEQHKAASSAGTATPVLNKHKVQKGETASAIALREGISLSRMQQLNPGVNLNKLSIGQQLVLHASNAQEKSKAASSSETAVPALTKHKVQKGETASAIAKREGISLALMQQLNPGVDLNKLSIGQQLVLHGQTVKEAANAKTNEKNSDIITQDKYNNNLGDDEKKLKEIVKSKEGKKAQTYFAPEGKSTIGYGHQLVNKPAFLKNIENEKITLQEKKKKLDEALKDPTKKALLKASIQADLSAAIKNTGIKNVPSTISDDLKLTDAQIDLLTNSDVKNVKISAEKEFGKELLSKRTVNQRAVLLDLYYNTKKKDGSFKAAAPQFSQAFIDGDIDKAQAEIDFFKCNNNGKQEVQLGLIRRCFERMMLLNDNKGISPKAKDKILKAYNEYCANKNKKLAATFDEINDTISKA